MMHHFKKVRVCAAIVLAFISGISAQAQSGQRNKIRASYGDGTYMEMAFSLVGLATYQDLSYPGTFSVAYRHLLEGDRWAIGGDFTYTPVTAEAKETRKKEDMSLYMIMAGVDYNYIKSGMVRLYGTASAGLGMSSDPGFAFQVNPIALRIGNDRIAGFAEAGVGMKGIVNVGIEIGF